jgi:hypothetical protein
MLLACCLSWELKKHNSVVGMVDAGSQVSSILAAHYTFYNKFEVGGFAGRKRVTLAQQ